MKFNFSFLKSKKCIRFFQISGGILAFIIILLLVVPSFLNLDKYKDPILDKVNSNLNGSVNFDSVSLSLITGPKVKVKNISLKDEKGNDIVSVDTLYFNIPILSIVTFSPKIILDIKQPNIKIVQNKNNINISTIVKQSPKDKTKTPPTDKKDSTNDSTKDQNVGTTPDSKDSSNKKESKLLNIIRNSYYTLIIDNASFSFTKDNKELISLHDLSFTVKNLSLVHNSEFDISTNVNFKKDAIFFQGPISILGKLTPNDTEKNYGININIDLKKVLYNISDILVKKASDNSSGVNININFNQASSLIKVENLDVLLPDLSIKTSGNVSLNNGEVNLKNSITYKKNDSDISLDNSVSIKNSKYNLVSNINSTQLNVNTFIPKKTNATTKNTKTSSDSKSTSTDVKQASNSQKGSSQKQSIDIKIPPIVKDLNIAIKTNIKKLKYDRIDVTNFVTSTSLKNSQLNSKVALNVFKAKINTDLSTKLNNRISYEAKTTISSLDLKSMMAAILPVYQNTLGGVLSFNNTTTGSISNDILATTTSTGNFSVEKPVIATLDSREILEKALSNAVEKIKDKFKYDLSSLPNYARLKENLTKQKFESDLLTASFSLKDKKVVIPSFILKATKDNGIDITGNANIDLNNQDLLSSITLIDTYNLTKAADLSIDKEGFVINNILTKEDKIFKIPVSVGCKINAPCYKYDKTSQYLLDIVEDKSKEALKNKGKAILKKEAEKLKKEFFFLK